MASRAPLLAAALALASACSRDEPNRSSTASRSSAAMGGPEGPADRAAAAADTGAGTPFRFEPTLRAHAPAGAEIAPLVEISEPAAYQVRIVAAIQRPGEAPSIELSTFDMRNEREVLEPVGAAVPILRVRADQPRAPELDELRRRYAAPGVEVRRPQGLPDADANAVVGRLQAAATTVRDEAQGARARVRALAELVQGTDDALVLQRDALPETMDALLAAGTPTGLEQLSERRAVATTASHRLELARKREGWMVVAIEPR